MIKSHPCPCQCSPMPCISPKIKSKIQRVTYYLGVHQMIYYPNQGNQLHRVGPQYHRLNGAYGYSFLSQHHLTINARFTCLNFCPLVHKAPGIHSWVLCPWSFLSLKFSWHIFDPLSPSFTQIFPLNEAYPMTLDTFLSPSLAYYSFDTCLCSSLCILVISLFLLLSKTTSLKGLFD